MNDAHLICGLLVSSRVPTFAPYPYQLESTRISTCAFAFGGYLSALRQGAQAPGSYLPPAPPVLLETSESGSTGSRTCLTSALRLWQPRLCLLLLPFAFSVRYSYNANHPHAIFQPERSVPHASPLCPNQTYQHCTSSTRKVYTLSAAVS